MRWIGMEQQVHFHARPGRAEPEAHHVAVTFECPLAQT